MITPAHVRADVIDIRNLVAQTPDHLVVDANVLYWVFYPNFAALGAAGGRCPQPYQTNHYPTFWSQAERGGCEFYTVTATLGEFTRTSEFAELEAHWLMDAARPAPPHLTSPRFDAKFCRYHYAAKLASARQDIDAVIAGVLGTVAFLRPFPSPADEYQAAAAAWQSSSGDFPDAVLVAASLAQGFTDFLSDDADLATFGGITLYTANASTVSAARVAGRLLN